MSKHSELHGAHTGRRRMEKGCIFRKTRVRHRFFLFSYETTQWDASRPAFLRDFHIQIFWRQFTVHRSPPKKLLHFWASYLLTLDASKVSHNCPQKPLLNNCLLPFPTWVIIKLQREIRVEKYLRLATHFIWKEPVRLYRLCLYTVLQHLPIVLLLQLPFALAPQVCTYFYVVVHRIYNILLQHTDQWEHEDEYGRRAHQDYFMSGK